jgi:regulator of RNase E activity RraA
MAGWALTVTCPGDNNLATFLALQYMLDTAKQGRWIMVIKHEDGSEETEAAMWNYLQCSLGREVGFVGAVVEGFVTDAEELKEKMEKEFSLFAHGTSPVPPTKSIGGEIGAPVTINGVTIRTGDLIVGDSDGVMCIPRDMLEKAAEKCRHSIVDEVNRIQLVREGKGAVDVTKLRDMLMGNVEIVD